MRTPLFFTGSTASNVSNSADRYAVIAGTGLNSIAYSTLAGGSFIPNATQIAVAGTISALRMRFPQALQQGSFVITLYKGAAQNSMTATALTATLSGSAGNTNTDSSDLAHTVSVAAGDYVAWRITPSGTPTAQTGAVQISSLFEATTTGRQPLFAFIAAGTTAGFVAPGCGAASNGTEANYTVVLPSALTVRKMYVSLSGASGAAPGTGNSRTITLRKGTAVGALSDTTLTVTFGATDIEKVIDLAGSPLSLSAGDFLSIGQTITGTPASSPVKICIEVEPAVSGESVRFSVVGAISTSATRYGGLSGANPTTETTEANTGQLAPTQLTVKSIRVDTTTAPGTSKSRAVTLRAGATLADTALVATLSSAVITATATTNVTVNAGDTLDYSHVPNSAPAASAWTSVSSIMVASALSGVNFSPTDVGGQTFEGIRNTSKIVVGGAYSGTPTDVQVSLWDAATGGTIVSAWASATTQTGGVYGHTFSGVAVGGPYYCRVRDNGGANATPTADLYVGAVVVLWGQSQAAKLHTQDTSGLTPSNGWNVRLLNYGAASSSGASPTPGERNVVGVTPNILKFDSSTVGLAIRTGSGIVALAKQWHADVGASVPLMIVTSAYQGTSIEYWVNNRKGDYPTNQDTTTLWGTSPTTGFAWFMANAAKYQATAIIFDQGTADVGNDANVNASGFTYAQLMDQLKTKFESLYNGVTVAPLFLVDPHQRSDDGAGTWTMRSIQYAKSITSSSTWRTLDWALDIQMDGNGSPHQADGATGNIRKGTRMGRGLAKHLNNISLDIAGPQIVSAVFNAGRAYFDITFDRDIETPSAVTTGIQGVFVSTDSGTTYPTAPASITWTAAIQSARVLRVTSTGSAFPAGTTRVDFFRGIPFASDTIAADVVGTEANMETDFLSKVIVDTTSFDGGRGMPVAPVMGTGFGVGDGTIIGNSAATLGTLTLSASGAVAVSGAAGVTLSALTVSATGGVTVRGSAGLTLGSLSLSAAGLVGGGTITGSATITLGSVVLAASGVVSVRASAAITLGDVASSGSGTVSLIGIGNITLGDITLDAQGILGLITTPADEKQPVTISEAKAWLKIETNDDDTIIGILIDNFCDYSETSAGVICKPRSDVLTFAAFTPRLALLRTPIRAVTAVDYEDGTGSPQSIASGFWQVVPRNGQTTLQASFGASWPYATTDSVEITADVGYLSNAETPGNIRMACLEFVAQHYQNREGGAADLTAVDRMLASYRTVVA